MASTRRFLLPALLILFALPAMARSLDAPKAPPVEPVYEVDPGERPGYTRVMGHWEWTGENFMWSPGKWVAEKEGAVWVADTWTQRGKKWHLTPGHYEPDGTAPAQMLTEESEFQSSHSDHPDVSREELKERAEPFVKSEEMDDVEQKVLAPSTKTEAQTGKAGSHRVRHLPVKKAVNYNDPKQFPFYQHH